MSRTRGDSEENASARARGRVRLLVLRFPAVSQSVELCLSKVTLNGWCRPGCTEKTIIVASRDLIYILIIRVYTPFEPQESNTLTYHNRSIVKDLSFIYSQVRQTFRFLWTKWKDFNFAGHTGSSRAWLWKGNIPAAILCQTSHTCAN